jgi:hypothetical protein
MTPIKWPPPALVPGAGAPKIKQPGVYAMPLDLYHSDCCVGPSVSSGGLRTIEAKSLAHYWAESYLNPDRAPFKRSPAMMLGQAAHHLVLGEEGFAALFACRPEKWADWRTNDAKKWREDQEGAGKTVLDPKDLTVIKGVAKSLSRHPLIRDGLLSGSVEQSMIWQDAETGIWCKSRPDVRAAGDRVIADLKTTKDASLGASERTMDDYGYHMQLALAGEGTKALFGVTPGNSDYVFVFVETEAPYCVTVRPVDIQDIGYGRMQNRRSLRKLAKAFEKNDFPGYDNDMTSLSLPPWRRKQLEEQVKMGLLDTEEKQP